MNNRQGKKTVFFEVPESLHQQLKIKVVKEKRTIGGVLTNFTERYVKKELDFKERA